MVASHRISWVRIILLAIFCGTNLPFAAAQKIASDLVSDDKLRSLGLMSAWHTQVEFDSTRGRLAGIGMYYDDLSAQYIVQIKHPAGRVVISEQDLNPLGKPLGITGAKKKAEQWIADWKLRHPKSKDPVPEMEELQVPDVFLAVTSQRGMVQGFNGETGSTKWVSKIGNEMLPTMVPSVNYNRVAVINGSKLFLLNKTDGKVIWEKFTREPPGGGPALSSQFAFVPMLNGMMETFDLTKDRKPATTLQFRSFGRVFVQPVVFKDAIAWTTDQGNVYVGNSEANGVRYRITLRDDKNVRPNRVKTSSSFTPGSPTFLWLGNERPAQLYFGTEDGYVLCCEADRGSILARFSAGEPVSQSPVVVHSRVYSVTDNDNLFCMDSMNMMELWSVSGIHQFLAASEDRIYVQDSSKNLVALDAKTGSRIGAVPMGNIDFVYTNTLSDRIYLGNTSGVIQCIHETKRHFPWVHSGAELKKKFEQVLNQNKSEDEDAPADAPAEEMKAKPAAGDDPFGGAEEPAMKKEAKPAMDADDPFK